MCHFTVKAACCVDFQDLNNKNKTHTHTQNIIKQTNKKTSKQNQKQMQNKFVGNVLTNIILPFKSFDS